MSAPAPTPAGAVAKTTRAPRPARKQVEQGEIKRNEKGPQTGQTYNIWYNKWAMGERDDSLSSKEKAQTRVDIARDSGYTRGDANGIKYCCLFFARGCCPYGSQCAYLHRLPKSTHTLPDLSRDIFGREKFADYRDDMGGVGSFGRQNRTLYIGRMREAGRDGQSDAVVRRHFGEFGEIERLRVLHGRSVAFVTYVHEANAQFAREAMANQSMDEDEILNVRWATEDPNPVAKVREKRRLVDLGTEGVTKKLALDTDLVQAVRQVEALEHGLPERPALEEPEEEPQQEELQVEQQQVEQPQVEAQGILSAQNVQALRYLAQLREQGAVGAGAGGEENKDKAGGGLGGLAGYGSGSEEED